MDILKTMIAVNQRMSTTTAFALWKEKFHLPNLENPEYNGLYTDVRYLTYGWSGCEIPPPPATEEVADDIVTRLFYIISTSPDDTMSLATVASKLATDCLEFDEDYQANMQLYSDLVVHAQTAGLFNYRVSASGHPVITPLIAWKGEDRADFDAKFSSALPQIGGVMGELRKDNTGLVPGIRFTGRSTRRKTPLNDNDRQAITMVSNQKFHVDMNIINSMQYYVPTLTEDGIPLTEREQEDARTAYYRFADMAEDCDELNTVMQFPTTQDSRGRFYNAATDPAVRLSLRATKFEGELTEFEQQLLRD